MSTNVEIVTESSTSLRTSSKDNKYRQLTEYTGRQTGNQELNFTNRAVILSTNDTDDSPKLELQILDGNILSATKGKVKKVQKVVNNKTKKVETRVQRQVLLEDGKIIADTGPQVISRTIEDSKSEDIEKTRGKGGERNSSLPSDSEKSTVEESEESEEEIIDLTRPQIVGSPIDGSTIVAIPVKSNPVVRKKSSIIKRDKSASKEVLHYSDSTIKDLNKPSDYKAAATNPNSLLEPMENDFLEKIKGKLRFYSNKSKRVKEKDKITEKSRLSEDGKIKVETTHSRATEELSDEELPEQYVDRSRLTTGSDLNGNSHPRSSSFSHSLFSDRNHYNDHDTGYSFSQYPGGFATTSRRGRNRSQGDEPSSFLSPSHRSPSSGRLAIGYQLPSPVSFFPGSSATLGRPNKLSSNIGEKRSTSRLSNLSGYSDHIPIHSTPTPTRVYTSPSFDLKRWGLDTGKKTTVTENSDGFYSRNVMDREKAIKKTLTSSQKEEDDSSVLDREVGRRTAAVSSFFNTSFSTSKSETATKGRVEKGKENRMTLEGERNSALNQSSSSNNHNNKWRMKERASKHDDDDDELSVGTRRSAMKKDPSSLGEGKKDGRAKEKERIRLEVEAKSEEIRRKDEKARDMKVTSSPSSREGNDSKVESHRKEEKDEKSLFSAVPMKVATSSSEPTSIDEDLYHRSQPESKNVSKDVSTSSKIAIPLPYSQSTTTEKNEKRELNEESNQNIWKKSSTSPPPRPPPLERTISNVSSSVHASVQASLSSSSEDDEEEEERKGGEREKGGIRKGRRNSSSLLVDTEPVSDEEEKRRKEREDSARRRNQLSSFFFGIEEPINKSEEVFEVHESSSGVKKSLSRREVLPEKDRDIEEVSETRTRARSGERTRARSPEARIEKTSYVEIHPDCRPSSPTRTADTMSHISYTGLDTLSRRAAERRQRGIFLDGHEPSPPPPPPLPASLPPATLPKPVSWIFTESSSNEPRMKSSSTSPIQTPKMKRKGWGPIDPEPDYDFDTKILSNAQGNAYRLDIVIEPEKVPEPPIHRIFTTPSPTRVRKAWKPVSPTAKTKQMESVAKSRLFSSNAPLSKSPSAMIRSATITKSYSPTNNTTKSLQRPSRPITKTTTTTTTLWPSPPPMYRSSPTFVNRSKSSPVSSSPSPSPTRTSPTRTSPTRTSPIRASPTRTDSKPVSQRWPVVSASLTRPTISSRNKALSRS